MKLGTGKNKYRIKLMYIERERITNKNVYADSEEEAMKLFKEHYKNFNIKILGIKEAE